MALILKGKIKIKFFLMYRIKNLSLVDASYVIIGV